jgi:2-hydroxy-3-keto-5-methylthiopentenyl-1-phosphate phosphatase
LNSRPSPTPKRRVILCDFDGTVGKFILYLDFMHRFGKPGYLQILDEFLSHRICTDEAVELGFSNCQASDQEVSDFLNSITLDPAFPPFVKNALEWGYEYYIVSDGIDTFIKTVLDNNGLSELPVISNNLEKEADVYHLRQPWRNMTCPICKGAFGVCKLLVCRSFQEQGCEVIFIGDGFTDECGAAAADRVFATGSLLEYCRLNKITATVFNSFVEIQSAFEAMNSKL